MKHIFLTKEQAWAFATGVRTCRGDAAVKCMGRAVLEGADSGKVFHWNGHPSRLAKMDDVQFILLLDAFASQIDHEDDISDDLCRAAKKSRQEIMDILTRAEDAADDLCKLLSKARAEEEDIDED